MGKGEVRIYYNPKWYTPLGALKERHEREDAKIWEGQPGYQEQMGAKIFEMNKAKKEATNVCRVV